jgi:putative flavoprotein involved in K+ transport
LAIALSGVAAQHARLDVDDARVPRVGTRLWRVSSRDDWIRYLEDYSTHHRLEVRFDTEVRRVDRPDGAWRVETSGDAIEADAVVIAIGFDHDPHMPDWPGQEGYGGELIHASAYHDPAPY